MHDNQRTPDRTLMASDATSNRGQLRIFFGYAPEVGTTIAMIEVGLALKTAGKDVVVGFLADSSSTLDRVSRSGLPRLDTLKVPRPGANASEFDLDAALDRSPDLVILDDLAHNNPLGMRHTKRWQDVDELLAAGISVFASAHVQQIESLSNVIYDICGISSRETIPDQILDQADEITFVDLPPEEVLERVRRSKRYLSIERTDDQQNVYRHDSLMAMRELALRHVANHWHEKVQTARVDVADHMAWPTQERILACVGTSPTSARVIRAAKRLATPLHAEWMVVHVESANASLRMDQQRQQVMEHLKLAENLGAEVVQLSGANVARELLLHARQRNINRIVIGKTGESSGWFLQRKSLVDQLLRDSGNIDVVIVRGPEEYSAPHAASERMAFPKKGWLGTALALAAATLVSVTFEALTFSEANLVMVYLLAIVFVGVRFGAMQSAVASVAAVLLFDLLFTQPRYTLTVHDTEYLVTFSVMLGVGLLASSLTSRIRGQAEVARRNERRAESLYRLSRRLAAISGRTRLVEHAERAIAELFESHVVIFLPDESGKIRPLVEHPPSFAADASEIAAAQWACQHKQAAGLGTDTMSIARAVYVPLATPDSTVGVLAVQPEDAASLQLPGARQLLETCATQIALALERDMLNEQSQENRVQMETEKLRSSLLSAVSHDLRTPLAAIAGAASSLSQSHDLSTRQELLETICEESERLTRLVENLLHMTRLSSGRIDIDKQWYPVEDVVGSALSRLQRYLGNRTIDTAIPDELPLGHFDAVLIEQVLVNLIENAAKYSSADSPISIEASNTGNDITLKVTDRGIGVPPEEKEQIFEMFYRGARRNPDRRGTGLGLAICRAIVAAHGGSIGAERREGGGTAMWFQLPCNIAPPQIDMDLPDGNATP